MRYQGTGCDSVRNLLVSLLADLQPEIHARKVHVDLDLDEVAMRDFGQPALPSHASARPLILAAIRGLLADAIESSAYEGDLSVTLIDTESSWELELAVSRQVERDGTSHSEPAKNVPDRESAPAVFRGRNYSISRNAANQCGGQIQFLECPQGGSARVLVMPKQRTARAA